MYFMNEKNDDVKAAVSTAAGATVGGAGAVGAVSAMGSVAGLGAAGITSGLSAVGGLVGGGMAAGLVITAAAPIAVGALGYGLYKGIKKLMD
jgi:hypothetical protein